MATETAARQSGYETSVSLSPRMRSVQLVPSSEKSSETVLVATPKRPMKAA
tara:strand:+ start:532 stop:684 length:153 start_codon:yes stop_codon:yes gene_type:complete